MLSCGEKVMAREKMVVVDPEKIEWEPVENPEAPCKGMFGKLLSHNKKTGAMTVLAKLDKGFRQPEHTHPVDADIMVLEGKLVDEKGNEITKGMYWFVPAGVGHGDPTIDHAPEGCVVFVYFNGPSR